MLMLFLLLDPILFRIILSLLMHFQSFFATTAYLFLPFILKLNTVLTWRHRWLKCMMLDIQISWCLISVKVAILCRWCVSISCLLLKLLLIQKVGIIMLNMTVMLLAWSRRRHWFILMLTTISIHSLACTSCTSCNTSVVIHSTDVASAAFQDIHGSNGLNWPLTSLCWSFLVFHSQICYLRKESLLCSNSIIWCLTLMTY